MPSRQGHRSLKRYFETPRVFSLLLLSEITNQGEQQTEMTNEFLRLLEQKVQADRETDIYRIELWLFVGGFCL
jgi:hypothetical protein